ncbi:MAG: metal ABC transporter substrate-binding protein [Planctomycetaceae bacterium]
MRLFCIALVSASLIGCQDSEPEPTSPFTSTNDVVVASFYPMTWMSESLLKDVVPVECVLPDDQQVGSWQPTADAIQKLQSARLIVVNGAGHESWLTKVTLPSSRVVDTTAGFPQPLIRYENVVTHQHGPVGSQSLEGVDGHTWLDPIIAKHQAERIAEAAARAFPDDAAQVEKNLQSLHENLNALDDRFKTLSEQMEDATVLCAQQRYNYLGRRYGWKVQNLDWGTSESNLQEAVASFADKSSQQPTVCLWDSPPTAEQAALMDAAGIRSVVFLIGDQPSDSGDYLSVMAQNADRLASAMK